MTCFSQMNSREAKITIQKTPVLVWAVFGRTFDKDHLSHSRQQENIILKASV